MHRSFYPDQGRLASGGIFEEEHVHVQQVEHLALLEGGEGVQTAAGNVGQLPQPTLALAGDRSMLVRGGQLGAVTLQRITLGLKLVDSCGDLRSGEAGFQTFGGSAGDGPIA
ncbi:MAG: hypothetical protein M3252_05265 [Actinomycetota bacterium]|nr:hypothetical protein [Actinomycetota bacterium]